MKLHWTVASLLAASTGVPAAQADPIALPKPPGAHPVGTVTYHWSDSERRYSYSSFQGDFRQVVVQIWFPASEDARARVAPYSVLAADYRHVATNSKLRTPFAKGDFKCPLVLISPGRGVEHFGYSTIAEALASHGYVVASVAMPEIGYVVYPDGYTVKPNPAFRPSRELMAGPYERVDAFFEKPTEIGRLDLELGFEGIRRLHAEDPTGRFVGRIDVENVGIFGHSLGGRIAGAFAEKNDAVRAYASMEGIAPRRARLNGLTMPVAMLCSSGTLPYAKDNYQTLIDGRKDVVFMIELAKFGHNSVTDFPLITPARFDYAIEPRAGLETTISVIRSFFDVYLRKTAKSFSDASGAVDGVVVSTFEAPGKK